MRVCLVYDCLYPWTVGGAERWLRGLGERLASNGHQVTYLTRLQWPEGDPPHVPGVRVIPVSRREPLYGPNGNRTIGEPLRFGWGVCRHLSRHGGEYDVVHMPSFPYFSLLAAGAWRRRFGYVIVTDWFEVWSRSYWNEYLGVSLGWIGRLVQRACTRIRQRAFCFSQLHAERLTSEGLRDAPTILRGIYDGPVESPAPLEAQPLVFFAGRLIPEKRAPAIVAAVTRASQRIPGLRGMIFGDGPQKADVDAAIADLNAGGAVCAPGFVPAEDVHSTLRQSLCLLLPSSREGYGLIVVEAAAAGVPSIVVAGPDNAAVELIENGVNGFIMPSADPDTLADGIARVYDRGYQLRRSTADWFARNAQELSLQTSLKRVVADYASASARSATP
jgi:glycosyltransferase involved in cell wall biosynthesis